VTPRYSSSGNDAAVYEMNDGGYIVLERGNVGDQYDRVRADNLDHAVEIADAWQAWRDAVRRFDAGVTLLEQLPR